ncbi:hypothetical protein D3C87_2115400 [compost metagenome]
MKHALKLRAFLLADPEFRLAIAAIPHPIAELHGAAYAQRCQRRIIESPRLGHAGNVEADMIEHDCPVSDGYP